MRNIMGANFSLLRFIVLVLVVSCVSGHYFNEEKIDSHELGIGSDMAQTDPLIFIAEDTIAKRNNMNQFKNMMINNKDNQEMIADEDLASKDGQIYYIPRVASGNGKKRGAILSWALPANRVRNGNSIYRQPTGFTMSNSRPAAKK